MPPIIVARSPRALPKRFPTTNAIPHVSAVVSAMVPAANATFTESAAKLTPTARASILVAIAWSVSTGSVRI